MGSKILNFFKRLSVTQKVILCILAFLVTGYIFCLPRHLFHVPYSTVVTDRNEELLGCLLYTSYWPGNAVADEWITSYTGMFLTLAQEKGYAVHPLSLIHISFH